MHLKSLQHIRRMLAILMMGLLVLVMMIKVLHRHHGSDLPRAGNVQPGEHVQAVHACAICEYQLVKEGDLPEAITLPVILSISYSYFISFTVSMRAGMQQTYAGRGPPAA